MVDWVKGRSFDAHRLELGSGYAINVNIRQHQSGKVTVYQGVSKFIGTFEDFVNGNLDLDTSFMDKLNKVLLKMKEVS